MLLSEEQREGRARASHFCTAQLKRSGTRYPPAVVAPMLPVLVMLSQICAVLPGVGASELGEGSPTTVTFTATTPAGCVHGVGRSARVGARSEAAAE